MEFRERLQRFQEGKTADESEKKLLISKLLDDVIHANSSRTYSLRVYSFRRVHGLPQKLCNGSCQSIVTFLTLPLENHPQELKIP